MMAATRVWSVVLVCFGFGEVFAVFVESFEDLVAFFLALAGVPGLSADIGDFRVARMLNNAVGVVEG